MKTSTYTSKKSAEIAERVAAQEAEHALLLAALQAEKDALDLRLHTALEQAGAARVAFVEDLLERFGVDPTPLEPMRHKRTKEALLDRSGQPRLLNPDADETQRMQRLSVALDQQLERAERGVPTTGEGLTDDRVDDDMRHIEQDAQPPEEHHSWAS
jgi:hypothetical protein